MNDHRERTGALDVSGKVVWVTGAGKGLGRGIALGLAESGATVIATARTTEDLDRLAADAEPGSVIPAPGSVTDPALMDRIVDRIVAEHGRLDVAVGCAGISPIYKRSEMVTDAEWRQVLDTNLDGAFYTCRAAAGPMLEAGQGVIINVTSIHGQVGAERMAPYAAGKGAVEALTKSLAVEWAPRGVRVVAVAPGYYYTDLSAGLLDSSKGQAIIDRIPLGRLGIESELASAVVYLASDSARYITGTTLNVDGGWTAQ